MRKILLSFVVLFAASCQTPQRFPASTNDSAILGEELVVELLRQKIEGLELQAKGDNPEVPNASLAKEISSTKEILNQKRAWIQSAKKTRSDKFTGSAPGVPQSETFNFGDRWRNAEESFLIPHTNFYKANDKGQYKTFFVNNLEARSVKVNLRHRLLMEKSNSSAASPKDPSLSTEIRCKEDFTTAGTFSPKRHRANELVKLAWYDYQVKGEIVLGLNENFTSCEVRFTKPESKEVFGFQLAPESKLLSQLEFIQNNSGTCLLPDASKIGPLENLFLHNLPGNHTCPRKVGMIRSLEDSYQAINAKTKALIGYELTKEQLDGPTPYLKFDETKLPKLDAIFISALVFRSDFYGTLILNMLEAQALRGAQVRILMAETTAQESDFWRIWDASAQSPNIKLIPFRYKPQAGTGMDQLSKFHRSMHTKLMITYSKNNPQGTTAVFGGRNFADPYAFKTPKDLSEFKPLMKYDPKKWLRFEDYEMEVQDPVFNRELMAQYMNFYNFDYGSMNARNLNVGITAGTASPAYFAVKPNEGLVRHMMSFPFRGDTSLEDFYVKAFDSAQKTVKISSPYFSPTNRIGEAMVRASDRGVKIEVITGLNFEGDTAGSFLGEVNKTATNKLMSKVAMYSYTEPRTVLHSKLVMIDDRLSLVGSVNLNQRSFYHDSENVLMVYSPEYTKHLVSYFETYKAKGKQMTEPMKAVYWKKILLQLFKKEF